METILQYDDTLEKQLNALICIIDDRPIIKIYHDCIHKVSYLGVDYNGSEGFRVEVQSIYDQFIKYINQFIQHNSANPEFHTHIASTLSRLLANYQNAHKQFTESPLRKEWKTLSQFYKITNPQHSGEVNRRETYFRYAYDFFYRVSSIQLEFLDEVISYLSYQLQPFKNLIQDVPQSKNIALIEESKPVYFFKITKQTSLNSRHILQILHEGLKGIGYIDCTLPQFKRLFVKYYDKNPDSTPPAIIWKCEHYNHLGYFIKCLISGKFISYAKIPSNNEIALNLFHNGKEHNPYSTKGKRYGGRLSPIAKAKIDAIIKDSGLKQKLDDN
jgi:hypothetical protein